MPDVDIKTYVEAGILSVASLLSGCSVFTALADSGRGLLALPPVA